MFSSGFNQSPVNRQLRFFFSVIFGLLTQLSAAQTTSPVLDYHLNWPKNSSWLEVRLVYSPVTPDSTVFTFGSEGFGGQKEIFSVLKQITGSPDDSVHVLPASKKIVVYHHGSSLRQLTYRVDGQLVGNPNRATYDELFRPVITDKSLYMTSLVFMVTPERHPARKVGVQWDAVDRDKTYFVSAAPKASPLTKLTLTPEQSQELLIVAGSELAVSAYQVGRIPYYSIVATNVVATNDSANAIKAVLDPFFKDFFPAIRNFWHDQSGSYYYLCTLPLLSTTKPASGGFGWGPGFIFKYAGPFDDSKKLTIGHENAHYWIGQQLSIGSDNFSNQWFGEGFNDYVAVINLVRSGIFSTRSYLDYVNRKNFDLHYTSPVRDSSNASIAKNYWRDKQFEKLPYRRGFIYAFYLDHQIRLATQGRHSLRDALLRLFDQFKKKRKSTPDASLSQEDFIDAAAVYLPKEQIKREVETNMIDGKPLDFHQIKLVPGFTVQYEGTVPVLSLNPTVDLLKFYNW